MPPSPISRARLALDALLALAAAWFAWTCWQGALGNSNGFPSYFTASTLLREGVSPARFYDSAWYGLQVQRFVPGMREIFTPNPPTMALLLLPLTGLPIAAARVAWTVLNVGLLAACVAGLRAALGLSGVRLRLLGLFALAGLPVHVGLLLGQSYLVAAVLWVGVLAYAVRGEDARLGAALAALMLLKTGGALVWAVLLVQRRWRALGWATAWLLAGVAACWPWIGLDAWLEYLRVVPPQLREPWIAATAHQSVLGLLTHVGRFDAQVNPAPLFDAPQLVAAVSAAVAVALSGAVLWQARKAPPERVLAAAMLAQLVLVPVSAEYHYAVAMVPLAVLLTFPAPTRAQVAAMVTGGLLLSLDLHHHSPRLVNGAWALLAYPLLYGALLWLAVLLQPPRAPAEP